MRQTGFDFIKDYKRHFGGSLLSGKRKNARPLSTKKPIHLVLKSSGSSFFNPGNRKLEKIIRDHAQKYCIKLYDISFNWSHVHLLLQLPTRSSYLAFIRTVTAAVVSFLTKLKGESYKGIFDLRPFTRVLSWGRDLRNAFAYFEKNDLEGWGLSAKKKKSSAKVASG